MLPLQFKLADEQDSAELAAMNRALIVDQGSRNTMDEAALTLRMKQLLRDGWRAALLLQGSGTVGYALFQEGERDGRKRVYVRQYYIRPELRRLGLGREGLRLLRERVFPASAELTIDVLDSNPRGRAFWESLGFRPYSARMELAADDDGWLAQQQMAEQDIHAVMALSVAAGTSFGRLLKEARAVIDPRRLTDYVEAGGVGAALLAASGRIYTGVCIDTACSMGFCAEQAAAAAMITHGESSVLKMVAVGGEGLVLPPCGRCREFISQLHPDNAQTEVMVDSGTIVTLQQLLPYDWRK